MARQSSRSADLLSLAGAALTATGLTIAAGMGRATTEIMLKMNAATAINPVVTTARVVRVLRRRVGMAGTPPGAGPGEVPVGWCFTDISASLRLSEQTIPTQFWA